MPAPSAERSREKHERVGSEHDHGVCEDVRGVGRGGHRAECLEGDPSRADDRTVVQTRGFGPFCGDIASEADTDDGRDASRDGCEEAAGNDREDDRDGKSGEDCAPNDLRRRSWSCDPPSVGDVSLCAWTAVSGKRNRSARPTRIGGFAKGAESLKTKTRRDSVAGTTSSWLS